VTEGTVADRRLHPATLFIRFIKRAPEFVLGLPALVGFASDANMRKILLIAAVGAIVSFAVSLMSWLRFRYGVGMRDLVIESGVLNRQRRVIPFDRVQDIDIEQRFLARLFGTAKVRIETGGGGKDEGSLDTIHLAEAHRIRDIIRRSAVQPAEAAPEVAQAGPEEPILFEMPLPRLLLAGLFNFSLFYLAVIGAGLQYLEPLLERNVGDPKKWIAPAGETAAQVGVYVTVLLLAVVLLLGVVTGVLRTVARDYRFRLSRMATGFRRQRGLFTLSEVVIPLRRVQLAVVGSGWLRRRLGWYSLEFQTLGADAQQSGHQPAAPLARIEEIEPILAEAGIEQLPPEESYIRVSRLAVLRRYLADIIPLALLAIAAALFWPQALLAFTPLAVLAALVVLQWRRHRYVLTKQALYVSEGLLRHRLWIMPYGKAQTISVTRSPLQRSFGLASVAVDTAGASLFRSPMVRDLEANVADALAARLLEEYRSARALKPAPASPVQVIGTVNEGAAVPALDHEGERQGGEPDQHRS
jgi:putative membrane protein